VAQHDHGDVHGALATLERARLLLAPAPEQRRSYSSLDLNYGFVLCGLGEYAAALRHLDQAVDNSRAQTPGWLPLMVAYRAQLWLHLGQPARAQRDLDGAVPGDQTPAAARSKWTVAFAQTTIGHGARSAEALARLDAVIAALPTDGRKLLRWRPQLARLPHLDDEQSLPAAQALLDEVRAAGRQGLAISAGAWLAQRLVQAGRRTEAAALARRTLGLLNAHAPDNVYRGTVWRQCATALESDTEALQPLVCAAAAWIGDTARQAVPPEFRESFVERNIDNRELLRLATRLRA
jgi:tetratricopeptide (TPR) repeat protein